MADIEAYLTQAIQDELVDSVIEYNINGAIFHQFLEDFDTEYDWGGWDNDANIVWDYNEVTSHCRLTCNKKPVDYSETTRRKPKPPTESPTSTNTVPTSLQQDIPTSDNDELEDLPTILEDYNNKAKSVTQNEERTATPYLGKPSKVHYDKYARHFGGLPEKTIEKTFQNTTQLGRLGAVKGLKLWKRWKAPNMALNVPRRLMMDPPQRNYLLDASQDSFQQKHWDQATRDSPSH